MVGPNEDSLLTATTGTIMDPDVISALAAWQWGMADTSDGTYANIDGATAATFTPLQEHVGKFLQACGAFLDNTGALEILCWNSVAAVANVNDAPTATDNTIMVSNTADADNPYKFSASAFAFADEEDGDSLASVTIVTLPTTGTLSLNGTALSAVPESPITAAQLEAGALTYYPAADQQPTDPSAAAYDSFTFRVTDDGDQPDADTDTTSANAATMSIRLAVGHLRLRLRLFLEGPLR